MARIICANETCGKEIEQEHENQRYCPGKKCRRARVMRLNRAKKNTVRVAARAGDIKECEFCHEMIRRAPRSSDFHWSKQKVHKACYNKGFISNIPIGPNANGG